MCRWTATLSLEFYEDVGNSATRRSWRCTRFRLTWVLSSGWLEENQRIYISIRANIIGIIMSSVSGSTTRRLLSISLEIEWIKTGTAEQLNDSLGDEITIWPRPTRNSGIHWDDLLAKPIGNVVILILRFSASLHCVCCAECFFAALESLIIKQNRF